VDKLRPVCAKGKPGDGGSAAVTGASWEGNGLVETQSGRILFTIVRNLP